MEREYEIVLTSNEPSLSRISLVDTMQDSVEERLLVGCNVRETACKETVTAEKSTVEDGMIAISMVSIINSILIVHSFSKLTRVVINDDGDGDDDDDGGGGEEGVSMLFFDRRLLAVESAERDREEADDLVDNNDRLLFIACPALTPFLSIPPSLRRA